MKTKEIIENLKLMQSQVEWNYPMDYAVTIDEAIEAVKIADLVKQRIGDRLSKDLINGTKWISVGGGLQCPNCGRYFKDAYDMDNFDNYCRHCGTKLEGIREK